jgi:AraC-like DNA-binding protein
MLNNYYRKSLILVLIVASIPCLLFGVGVYTINSSYITKQLHSAHQADLQQTMDRMEDQFNYLEMFAYQLALNPAFDSELTKIIFHLNFERTRDLYTSLTLFSGGNPLIESIALYLHDTKSVISDESGVRRIEDQEMRSRYEGLMTNKQSIYWVDQIRKVKYNDPSQYRALVIKLTDRRTTTYGALLIYINQNALDRLVNNQTSNGAFSWLMRDSNIMSSQNTVRSEAATTIILSALEHMRLQNNRNASLQLVADGETYSVSYRSFNRLGESWQYVSATPLSVITNPLRVFTTILLILGSAGIVTAGILSWFASRRLYGPVRRIVSLFHNGTDSLQQNGLHDEIEYIEKTWQRLLAEQKDLQMKWKQVVPQIQDGFLLQYTQGYLYFLSEDELAARINSMGWDATNSGCAVAIIQMGSSPMFQSTSFEYNEELMTFAAANIVEEISRTRFQHVKVINLLDLSVGVLFFYDRGLSREEVIGELYQLADTWLETLGRILKIRVTTALGGTTEELCKVPDLFEQTRRALHYRNPQETGQILNIREMNLERLPGMSYPIALEQEIIRVFTMGLWEETGNLLHTMVSKLVDQSTTEISLKHGLIQLLSTLRHLLLSKGIDPMVLEKGEDLYTTLMSMNEPERMINWFREAVILPFISLAGTVSIAQIKHVLPSIVALMKQELTSDISLEHYAEQFGIKPYTLSRAFKDEMKMTFMDFLTELRIAKAKELLLTTDLQIQEIADIVHYQPSYLIRQFRKHVGLTPGQFRDKMNV